MRLWHTVEKQRLQLALIHAREARADCEQTATMLRQRINAKPHYKNEELALDQLESAAADLQKGVESIEDLLR